MNFISTKKGKIQRQYFRSKYYTNILYSLPLWSHESETHHYYYGQIMEELDPLLVCQKKKTGDFIKDCLCPWVPMGVESLGNDYSVDQLKYIMQLKDVISLE